MVVLAFTERVSPVSKSVIFAPTTFFPFITNSSQRVRVVITAPYFAAVLAMVMVWRASSIWASKYWYPPVMTSRRSDGAISLIFF